MTDHRDIECGQLILCIVPILKWNIIKLWVKFRTWPFSLVKEILSFSWQNELRKKYDEKIHDED